MSVYATVFNALVNGFHGAPLANGEFLQSSTTRSDGYPHIVWKVSGFETENWQPFQYRVSWDIPAEILVQGPPSDPLPILDVLGDMTEWADAIYGLPVDSKGNVIPVGDEQEKLREAGKLFVIADRFVGPYIRRASVRPGESESSFTVADVLFHVEFVVDNSPQAKTTARYFTLGANVFGGDVQRDPTDPYSYPQASLRDTRSQGAYASPAPQINASFPPILPASQIPMVLGPDPSNILGIVVVQPASATITSTKQLRAIGTYVDGSTTIDLTSTAQWSSTAPLVASVNSSGLVTKVSVGSTNITATFNGLVGACAVTTA